MWGTSAASVERGPLVFPLRITENAPRLSLARRRPLSFLRGTFFPGSPWNYGLLLNEANVASRVKDRREKRFGLSVGYWQLTDRVACVGAPDHGSGRLPEKSNPALPKDPQATGDVETVTLVPYGSTRLRLTVLPRLLG